MQRVSTLRGAGFSLVEAMVVLAVLGVLLAIGLPSFQDWLLNTRVKSASEFYLEGLRMARAEAIKHNSSARLVLVENAVSGQFDWRIDICFRTTTVVCDTSASGWSTETTKASGDPETTNPFKSKLRSSDSLPKQALMDVVAEPAGTTDIYFASNGWLNTNISPRLTLLSIGPAEGQSFTTIGLSLTLAGVASSCLPNAATGDSRKCP